jgi:DNA invertase Pin-like site-specific DNA recombinase/transposase
MPIVARPRLDVAAAIVYAKYTRVSTLDQLEGFGLEAQDDICDGWARRFPDARCHDEYREEAISGSLESRPAMDRLIGDARTGAFNRILVPKVDRIGRTGRAAYQWVWNMADIGIHFISVQEGIDTSTEQGWNAFMQYVTFSEMEWRRIRERTFAGRELKISFGGWPGGPAPYGYRIAVDPDNVVKKKRFSVLVTDERESMILHVAADLIIGGKNITQTAIELNDRGLLTRSRVPWTVGNLRNRLLSETIHEGYVVYRKINRGNGKRTTTRYEDGTPVYGEPVNIGVPPIFTEERAKQLRAAMRMVGFVRSDEEVYPLSGRIFGSCGNYYTGVKSAGERAYRCKGGLGSDSCGEMYFRADEIEGAIWSELTKLFRDETRLKDMAAEWLDSLPGDKSKYERRVEEFDAKIRKQSKLIEETVPQYMREKIDPKIMAAAVRDLQAEMERFVEQRDLARQWLDEYREYERQALNLSAIAESAKERLDNLSSVEQKEIFEMFNLKVVPGATNLVRRSGVRCAVMNWHYETGTLVPPDPTDEEWAKVEAYLLTKFYRQHFTGPSDVRTHFNGCLHRLRHGIPWADMPDTWGPQNRLRERQLTWWKKGVWPEMLALLHADRRGAPAYQRPSLPQLTVTGQLRGGLLAEVRTEGPQGFGKDHIKKTVDSSLRHTGFESPIQAGADFTVIVK